jgi:hypothetical protein
VEPGHPHAVADRHADHPRAERHHVADALVPGMNGSDGFTGQSPSAACTSVWHTPLATRRSSTSPGPGVGIGTCSIDSGRPNACTTAAFIVADMIVCSPG